MKVNYKKWAKAYADYENTVTAHLNTPGGGLAFEIKRYIPFGTYTSMIANIASLCISDGRFFPAMFDTVVYTHVLGVYTNLNCDVEFEHVAELIGKTNVTEILGEHVDIERIKRDAMSEVREVQRAFKEETEVDKLARSVNQTLESVMNVGGEMSSEDVSELVEMLKGIDASDMEKLVNEMVRMKIVGDEK